jgi:hypothetical protein
LDDANDETTSGGLPLRIAAMILASLMPPTTSTSTPGVFLSYSAMSLLSTLSSCVDGRKPTQIVIFVAFFSELELVTARATPATRPSAARTTAAAARRLIMVFLPVVGR